jgi:acetoin:2,6-dichlorophenolindophenol oxidoreductase subunit beta
VIDLRTLWPWDKDAVLASVAKTGRLLVVQEAVSVSGFGAEIAATVAERLHKALKSPVKRLGAPRAPISYALPLEQAVAVTKEMIADAAKAMLKN